MNDIAPLPNAYFRTLGQNETTLVSTVDDPPKTRQGVKWQEGWGRSLGCHSFNHVRDNEVEDEIVLIQGKMDDRYEFGSEAAGELRWDLKAPGPNTDDAMVGVMNAFHDRIDFHVPVYAPNLNDSATAPSILSSPNGLVQLAAQDDGNLVLYVDGQAIKALFGLPDDQRW